MAEVPFELSQVRELLERDYDGLITGTGRNEVETERDFGSKALASFAVYKLSGCTLGESTQSLVDGGGDGGIDAIHFHEASETLWVVQSKFFNDGHGEPALGDVAKFKEGLENLLSGQFEVFEKNEAFAAKLENLRQIFESPTLSVRALLVYSGVERISDDRIRMFERLRERFSVERDYFQTSSYNLTSVHGWLLPQDRSGVDVTLTLHQPARVSTPPSYEMRYGLLSLAELSALYAEHGKRLIVANIREYKGKTTVNTSILATLQDDPHHFPYLNNGLTAYCSRMSVVAADMANLNQKRLLISDLSIVNGAQTLGSIATFTETHRHAPEGYVFTKIISLLGCEDERDFAKRLTRSTNFQNQVALRDFASLDDEQSRIAQHLELSGVHYHYKDSADAPDPDPENFSFDEALVALACLESDVDFCSRALSNRDSLRSQEAVYAETEPYPSRYRRLFRPDRSARTVWRCVQAKRVVIELMQANTQAETGQRKKFFENSRWLVLHLVIIKLHPEQGENLALSSAEIETLSKAASEIAEVLWEVFDSTTSGMHPKTIFSNAADCRRSKGAVLKSLNTS